MLLKWIGPQLNSLHKYFWFWLKQYKCVVWLFLWNISWKKNKFQLGIYLWGKNKFDYDWKKQNRTHINLVSFFFILRSSFNIYYLYLLEKSGGRKYIVATERCPSWTNCTWICNQHCNHTVITRLYSYN